MAEETSGFIWSQKSRLAAELVADDGLTDSDIAEKVGIGPRTLYRWKRNPVFVAEVERRVEEFREVIRNRGIARLERRIEALNDRWERMNRIIEARAADPAMADVPGGDTGLLVRRVKGVGRGDGSGLIESYEVDVRLLRELREHESQAAQELGQWGEKPDPMTRDKPPMIRVIEAVRPIGYLAEGETTAPDSLEQSVTVEVQAKGEPSWPTAASLDSVTQAAR